MAYSVKEVFYTLQGEGANSGRPAVFCRFSGCNLWNGLEKDRATAVCQFCDTDFVGTDGENGGRYLTAAELVGKVASLWPDRRPDARLVVCTGGEPMLQLDGVLVEEFHRNGFLVAVETNGTIAVNVPIDWICVSPKIGGKLVQTSGQELKFIFPQAGEPSDFETLSFEHFYLQPMDGSEVTKNTRAAIAYCLSNPKWRLSLQTHKMLGIP